MKRKMLEEKVKTMCLNALANGWFYTIRKNGRDTYVSLRPVGDTDVYADTEVWDGGMDTISYLTDEELRLF